MNLNQFIEGFLLQGSLILALGAQNLFVLESGLKKDRHLYVALICSLCDAVLIAIGVFGAASIFVKIPSLKLGFGILGVFFLFYYGIKKLKEGLTNATIKQSQSQKRLSLKQVVLLTLSFSLLNPHVYLDTVILIGGYSAKYSALEARMMFGLGAASFSTLWFFGLAIFAYYLSAFFNGPKAMRVISLVAGTILLVLSWKLGMDVYAWSV